MILFKFLWMNNLVLLMLLSQYIIWSLNTSVNSCDLFLEMMILLLSYVPYCVWTGYKQVQECNSLYHRVMSPIVWTGYKKDRNVPIYTIELCPYCVWTGYKQGQECTSLYCYTIPIWYCCNQFRKYDYKIYYIYCEICNTGRPEW